MSTDRETPTGNLANRDFDDGNSRTIIIAVQGNIGAGKSLIMKLLKRLLKLHGINVVFSREPVDLWVDAPVPSDGYRPPAWNDAPVPDRVADTRSDAARSINMLAKSYTDREKALFQMYAYMTRVDVQRKALSEARDCGASLVVSERCLDADRMFALLNRETMGDIGWTTYCTVTRTFKHLHATAHAYVRTDPKECFKRVHGSRARPEEVCEGGVTMELLEELHDAHEERWGRDGSDPAQIVIDGNVHIDECFADPALVPDEELLADEEISEYLGPLVAHIRALVA